MLKYRRIKLILIEKSDMVLEIYLLHYTVKYCSGSCIKWIKTAVTYSCRVRQGTVQKDFSPIKWIVHYKGVDYLDERSRLPERYNSFICLNLEWNSSLTSCYEG